MLRGFKCFNKGMTNRYGQKFVLNKLYSVEGDISFGLRGNGFHFCKNLEDTLRFFLPDEGIVHSSIIDMCSAESPSNDYTIYEDDYYGYYDMYAAKEIILRKQLTHEEIIEYMLEVDDFRQRRFIDQYYLNPDELEMFYGKSYGLDIKIKEKIKTRQYG